MITKEELGRRIAAARKDRNLIQSQLAYRTKMNTAALSHIESGLCYPSVPSLIKICAALRLDVRELLKE